MRSSISSSNQRLPALEWTRVLTGAVLIWLALAGVLELRLALRGFQPTVSDSEELWLEERARASELGERALILIGGSRIQLGADLAVLRAQTGLEPVQLAIDGSSFLPVFAGLAADDSIRGTVIVDFSDHLLLESNQAQTSHRWQSSYERAPRRARIPDFDRLESSLSGLWRSHLRAYADGAQPISSLLARLVPAKPTPQYLLTQADRSRRADYSKVEMPDFYYRRVMRNLGEQISIKPRTTFADLDTELKARIGALKPFSDQIPAYEAASRTLAAQAAAIRKRGGRVYFVMMPKSGLVKAIDDRRFPRSLFWDRFTAIAGTPAIHFEDVPAFQTLNCPDGSHLDYRQRAMFTAELTRALALAQPKFASAPPLAR